MTFDSYDINVVDETVQSARRSYIRVKLANGASGGIARVCKKRLSCFSAIFIYARKLALGKPHFTDHDNINGLFKRERNTSYRANIISNVLAGRTVSARGRRHQLAIFICKHYFQTIYFEFADIRKFLFLYAFFFFQKPLCALAPLPKFFFVKNIVKRPLRMFVFCLYKFRRDLSAHAPCRAVF